jgi:hypothetical protein
MYWDWENRPCSYCRQWPCRCPRLCACGGGIVVAGGGDEAIAKAVAEHNRTIRHRMWRKQRERA